MTHNYLITLRNGKSIRFTGNVDTISSYGYVLFCKGNKIQFMYRASEINQFRISK